jgi:hypothetical protein
MTATGTSATEAANASIARGASLQAWYVELLSIGTRSGDVAPGCSSDSRTAVAHQPTAAASTVRYTTEKTADVAPVPSASVSSPAAVKLLLRRIIAHAYRAS